MTNGSAVKPLSQAVLTCARKKKRNKKTENKTTTTKKCAAASTWWIGVFLLQPAPQKTKACRMFMESEPPWRFSMQELWTFSWGGCRGIQEEGGKNPLSLKKKKKKKKSQISYVYKYAPSPARVLQSNTPKQADPPLVTVAKYINK